MSIQRLVVAITGTPGTGKSVLARQLARGARGASVIEINDVVARQRLYSGVDRFGSRIVKLGRLGGALRKEIARRRGLVIVVGHLVPDLRIGQRITVVLRAELVELMKRMKRRGYPKIKIDDNIVSEALDYCGVRAAGRSAETYEVESAGDRKRLVSYILAVYSGKKRAKPRPRSISKMGELLRLVKGGYTL